MVTLSIMIGINLWLIPHTSEHCPNINPILFVFNIDVLICPGITSVLKFIDGIVHEWITSVDVDTIIICVFNGITSLLSVSNKLKLNFFLYII